MTPKLAEAEPPPSQATPTEIHQPNDNIQLQASVSAALAAVDQQMSATYCEATQPKHEKSKTGEACKKRKREPGQKDSSDDNTRNESISTAGKICIDSSRTMTSAATQGYLTADTIRCTGWHDMSKFSIGNDKGFCAHTRQVVFAVNQHIKRAQDRSQIADYETASVQGLVSLLFPELLGCWEV